MSEVMQFAELLPAVRRAHAAARLVIEGTGCQLASSLLTLDLDRQGIQTEYVRGYYSAAPEQEHWWVDAEGVLLDPTRDQFSEDPFAEHYAGEYRRVDAKPGSDMEHEATCHLRLHWSYNHRVRDAIARVAAQYGLDLAEIMEPPGLFMPVRAAADGA
jgi:hypothetical protein